MEITEHFVGEGTRVVPVGDATKLMSVLLLEGFTEIEIKNARRAWNFPYDALKKSTKPSWNALNPQGRLSDKAIIERAKSPREAFESIEKWHAPDSEAESQRLYEETFAIHSHTNPIAARRLAKPD